jgi:hypothetical protein
MWNPGARKPRRGDAVYNISRYHGPKYDHRHLSPRGTIIDVDDVEDEVSVQYECFDIEAVSFSDLEGRWHGFDLNYRYGVWRINAS